jgi:hypothetical protein
VCCLIFRGFLQIFPHFTSNGDPTFPFCDFHISGLADCCAFQLVMPMAMSEDHLCFRMLCFHRSLVRFMVHCSATYRDLETHGYSKPSTIRWSLHGPVGTHTNTIGSMWRHCKALLNPYDPVADYVHLSTNYTFSARCRCENFDHFTPSLQPFTSPSSGCSRNLTHCRPTTNNASRHPQIFCGAHSITDYV